MKRKSTIRKIKHLLTFGILLFGVSLFGQNQTETYKQLYSIAMKDSVITEEEQALLNSVMDNTSKKQDETVTLPLKGIQSKPLNQEGRYRVIINNMVVGNGLYGNALPYVLGIENDRIKFGSQMLILAGGFYTSWLYTKNIEIPKGRAEFQVKGATLGASSIVPLVSFVGFDNWNKFDESKKIALSYMMLATPIGIWKADQYYQKWKPTDGQAELITSGVTLGGLETWGIYSFLTGIPEENNKENWLRAGLILSYGGNLLGGYYSHEYVKNKSYTIGDAYFVETGTLLGFFSAFELMQLFEFDSYRGNTLLALSTVNASTYLSNSLVQDVDFTKGNATIISLGSVAGYLTWLGVSLIADIDYSSKSARIGDIVSAYAGYLLTYKAISNKYIEEKNLGALSKYETSFQPTLFKDAQKYIPGLKLEIQF